MTIPNPFCDDVVEVSVKDAVLTLIAGVCAYACIVILFLF